MPRPKLKDAEKTTLSLDAKIKRDIEKTAAANGLSMSSYFERLHLERKAVGLSAPVSLLPVAKPKRGKS